MACFQPEIVIVDRPYQNRLHPTKITTQGICKNLIAHQCALRRLQVMLRQAFPNALWERLSCVGDAVNIVLLTKMFYSVFSGIGHYTQLDIPCPHTIQPLAERLTGHIGGIGHDSASTPSPPSPVPWTR